MSESRHIPTCIECLKSNGTGVISYERIDYLCGSEEKGKITRKVLKDAGVGVYEMGGFVLTEKADEIINM